MQQEVVQEENDIDLKQLNKILIFVILAGVVAFFVLYTIWQGQMKARDARRKADLAEVKMEVEEFYKKSGSYPQSIDLPKDPDRLFSYTYEVTKDGKYFLYARLENARDLDVIGGLAVDCGAPRCNYRIP